MPVCPKCQATNLRRSRTRGLRGRFLKLWGWRTFRCRAENCRWRGMLKVEAPFYYGLLRSVKGYALPLVVAVFLFFLVLGYLLRNF
jgi:hypothetical protein